MPKLIYFLRTTPCFTKPKLIEEALIDIQNIPLTQIAHNQATFSVAKGGLGLWPIVEVAIPGFLSSVKASKVPYRLY